MILPKQSQVARSLMGLAVAGALGVESVEKP